MQGSGAKITAVLPQISHWVNVGTGTEIVSDWEPMASAILLKKPSKSEATLPVLARNTPLKEFKKRGGPKSPYITQLAFYPTGNGISGLATCLPAKALFLASSCYAFTHFLFLVQACGRGCFCTVSSCFHRHNTSLDHFLPLHRFQNRRCLAA